MGMFSPIGKETPDEYIDKYGLSDLSQQEIVRKIANDILKDARLVSGFTLTNRDMLVSVKNSNLGDTEKAQR